MRNSQPSGLPIGAADGERFHRLDQRILQHILAVDDRADHARAIAMQFRPHRDQQAVDIDGGRSALATLFFCLRLPIQDFVQHAVVADDRRATDQRRLGAALADSVLECLKRRQFR